MQLADFHVHSTASDGRLTPSEVVREAVHLGAAVIALTDHDTFSGVDEALAEAARIGTVKVIPGVEISASCKDKELHILALNPDRHDPAFVAFIESGRCARHERNLRMLARMQAAGYDIRLEDLQKSPDDSVTRANFARWMVDHGYAHSVSDGIERYLSVGRPLYEPLAHADPVETVKTIVAAGGHAVLAHPMLYDYLTRDELEQKLDELIAAGLEGIEAYYSTYTPEQIAYVVGLAARKGLFTTGGSDFHGSNKPHISLLTGCGNLRIDATMYPYLDEPIKE